MFVTMKSMFTGSVNTLDLPVTQAQLDAWLDGALIQDVMPHLTADDREFLMTGATPAEWEAAMGEES